MIARADELEQSRTPDDHSITQSITDTSFDQGSCIDTPVLIVGAGPSGLLQAYLLSRLGIECTIIERYGQRLAAPKAHALSPRTLEICRQFGLDTHQIRGLGTPRSEAYWVNFITNLSGETVGRLPYERMDVGVLDDTPEMIHNIPQPTFEQFVHDSLPNSVKIIRNASFVSCKQTENDVFTTVEDRAAGGAFEIRSKHVVACDGARSRVRSYLGIECEGEDSYETMMTIHFNADLRPVLGKEGVGMLHWVMDPLVSGFIIGYDLSGNQVLICNFDAQKHPVETWDKSLCRQVLDCAIGQKIPYEVLSFRPWVLSRKVARQYRSGRVFLAGDAAHSFPPTGGLGLNSGLGDVHNLAYKIAAVHQGWGEDGLLDTYDAERRHVAEVNSLQSVKNGKRIFSLLKAMGTTHPDVDQARLNLVQSLQDPRQRLSIDKGIQEQQEHFDNLELHIGYVYGSGKFPPHASYYKPKFIPGARLPHVWVQPSQTILRDLPEPIDLSYITEMSIAEASKRRYSSLDLCAHDAITIITSAETELLHKALEESQLGSIPIKIVVLGQDFELQEGPQSKAWLTMAGLNVGRTLIIRPDQHILAISESESTLSSSLRAIREHLGFRST